MYQLYLLRYGDGTVGSVGTVPTR